MKSEYDFSKAERGKFYHPKAKFKTPIYLDEEVQELVRKRAEEKGIDMNRHLQKPETLTVTKLHRKLFSD
jgi:hypothetical protein